MSDIIKRLDKIENKIDGLSVVSAETNKHLSVYNEQLKIHIKRTEMLEAVVEPIKRHVIMVNGIFKFLAYLAGLAGLIELFRS